ncbi:MAG: NADH:ubiquinone reductase (Na(+)-transporting) subunit C [Muribaculaceae bacterium]|nr:NADH:ubiquinone reductase (Na(+)-transporting) subunit C [Muribaculaceae bacterium]
MNKQSNTYTILYIIVMVIVVGAAMAWVSLSLHDRQQANADADTKRQILASVHITADKGNEASTFSKYITAQYLVDMQGNIVEQGPDVAFDINVAAQSKLADADRKLPVYVCTTDQNETKYIIPLYGAGLWGPIWGYVSFNADGSTIYGAYFAHQGETPGLGAEIEKPWFSDQFDGKTVIHNDRFLPVAVVKKGQVPTNGEDYVNGISGGTITSKGVSAMLDNCLQPYAAFLTNAKNQ